MSLRDFVGFRRNNYLEKRLHLLSWGIYLTCPYRCFVLLVHAVAREVHPSLSTHFLSIVFPMFSLSQLLLPSWPINSCSINPLSAVTIAEVRH